MKEYYDPEDGLLDEADNDLTREYDYDSPFTDIGLLPVPKDPNESVGVGGNEYALTPEGYVKLSQLHREAEGGVIVLYTGKRWDMFTIEPIEAQQFCYLKFTSGMKMHIGSIQKTVEPSGLVIKAKYLISGETLSQIFKKVDIMYCQSLLEKGDKYTKEKILWHLMNNMRTLELSSGAIMPVLRTSSTIPLVSCVMTVNAPLLLYKITNVDKTASTVLINGFMFVTEGGTI